MTSTIGCKSRTCLTKLVLLLSIGFANSATAAERELHLVAYADQELVYQAGVGAVVSRGNFDVVTRIQAIDRKNA